MAGDPLSTGLLIASAATTGVGLVQSRQQERVELAFLEAQTERSRLEATDVALQQAQGFRAALASQLAISSLRSGTGGSLVRQFGAASVSNFLRDQDVLGRRKDFIDIAASNTRAQIKANRFSRDISSIGSLIGQGIQSVNLNVLSPSGSPSSGITGSAAQASFL